MGSEEDRYIRADAKHKTFKRSTLLGSSDFLFLFGFLLLLALWLLFSSNLNFNFGVENIIKQR
jgi:hypothetical protein